jgi:serine/threonine-protein kinase RsbW
MTTPAPNHSAQADMEEVIIPNSLSKVREPERRILRRVRQAGYSEEQAFGIKLALEEALTNAIKHGNCNDPSKYVTIRYMVTPNRIIVEVIDEGCGFRPEDVPDPTDDANLHKPNGRGIMLMRAYMTRVEYNKSGNAVRMLAEKH